MRRKISFLLCLLLAIVYVSIPTISARAESLTVTGIPSQVKVGQTFNVSITVPKNVGGSVCVEYSADKLKVKSSPGSDVGTGLTSYTAFFNSSTETVSFEAKSSGSAIISVYMVDAEYSDVDPSVALPSIPKVSKTINIVNEVSSESTEPQKSGDNSLSSLKLSKGTLSPKFKYNVTKYTATVEYDVTKVVVSAKTSNAKATIESVTGDGTVNLKVGENTIEVVVRAENGVKAKYTIVVTRKALETTVAPDPTESESTSESETTTPPPVNEALQWNGEQLQVPETIPTESIPKDFESTSLVVNGQQMQGLSFGKGDLKVLYLNNTNGAGSLYVYDEDQQIIYPFIKLESEKSYVMVLVPEEDKAPAPEGFKACTFSIEGKGTVNAYQLREKASEGTEEIEDSTVAWNIFGAETFYAAEPKASDFYLIYCMNDNGEKGWYMYDSVEETFQRYLAMESDVQTGGDVSDAPVVDDEKYAELEKELKTAKMTQYITMGVAVVLTLILIVVIVVLVMKNRSKEDDFFEEYEEDDYEDEDEETVTEETAANDEIEIEFYNMEDRLLKEAMNSREQANDDDGDLEFVDFE